MFRIVTIVFLFIIIGFFYFFSLKRNDSLHLSLSITISANENTIYGRPWDGIRMGGAFRSVIPELPTQSPPDIAICAVYISNEKTQLDCFHKGGPDSPTSYCHDSYECTFDVPLVNGRSIGLISYDIDATFGADKNDLIDAFIIKNGSDDLRPLIAATREAISLISNTDIPISPWLLDWLKSKTPESAPNWMNKILSRGALTMRPSESLRRETDLKIFSSRDCREGCRLSQSTVHLR